MNCFLQSGMLILQLIVIYYINIIIYLILSRTQLNGNTLIRRKANGIFAFELIQVYTVEEPFEKLGVCQL